MKFTSRKPAILVSALLALALAACGEPTGDAGGEPVTNMNEPPATTPDAGPDAGAGFDPAAPDPGGFGADPAPAESFGEEPTEPTPGDDDFGEQADTPVDDTEPNEGPPPADRS